MIRLWPIVRILLIPFALVALFVLWPIGELLFASHQR